MELYEKLEVVFQIVILYASLAMEIIGVCILIITALKSVGGLLRKEPTVQLQLSKGVSLTLAFFMGAEVLRTVIAHEKGALITLGAIVAGLNFLDRKSAQTPEEAIEADDKAAEDMSFETVVGVLEGKEAEEAQDHLTAAALPTMPSPGRIAALITVMFAILSMSINVMQFAGGYSQIRPVNAIPSPVGLVFGPVGALACALGNLVGDLPQIGNYHSTVLLGFIGNFLSAYIPYKVWRAIDSDVVSVHTWRKIGLYFWSALLSCMSCALMLGFGLRLVSGRWYGEIVGGIFINNLIFTMALGLPVLIVLTSTDFGLGIWVTLQMRPGTRVTMSGLIPNKYAAAVCGLSTLAMGITFFLVLSGRNPDGSLILKVMAMLSALCVIALCLMQGKEANV